MNQIYKLAFVVLVTAIATCFSCKRDNDGNAHAKTRTQLLTSGTWKYTACTVSPAYDYYSTGNPVTDIFAILQACEKDDFETFKTNGTWEYNEGPTKCDPMNPQIFSEPWSFTANETKMMFGGVEHTILELTETTLKLRYSFVDSCVTYTEEDTYRH